MLLPTSPKGLCEAETMIEYGYKAVLRHGVLHYLMPACVPAAASCARQFGGPRSRSQQAGSAHLAAPVQRAAGSRYRAWPPPKGHPDAPGMPMMLPPFLHSICSSNAAWDLPSIMLLCFEPSKGSLEALSSVDMVQTGHSFPVHGNKAEITALCVILQWGSNMPFDVLVCFCFHAPFYGSQPPRGQPGRILCGNLAGQASDLTWRCQGIEHNLRPRSEARGCQQTSKFRSPRVCHDFYPTALQVLPLFPASGCAERRGAPGPGKLDCSEPKPACL